MGSMGSSGGTHGTHEEPRSGSSGGTQFLMGSSWVPPEEPEEEPRSGSSGGTHEEPSSSRRGTRSGFLQFLTTRNPIWVPPRVPREELGSSGGT
ncbi:hypothetical protein SLEP1_g19367 [Rubroshorea leprosula]|nr:hypothetical protein SLEP1_g19367 [Rubroshorea leprosula]